MQDALVLTPNRRRVWTRLAFAAVPIVTATIGIRVKAGPVAGLIAGALFAVMILLLLLHTHRSSIVLTPYEFIEKGLGFQRRRPRARIARLVRANVVVPRSGSNDTLYVLDANGEVVIRLYGANYSPQDIDRLVRALAVPCEGPDRPVTYAELARTHPHVLSWVERHPVLLAWVVVGVLLLLVAVFVLVMLLLDVTGYV
ncbi:hypothetical protein ACIRPH_08775 [Nocardiopsis sp. NPDC101807]|uniref:hypothetical protein n=1 Tax=Nocardiopsis sp. NPDC101807 TaxID=3364339 RepID=UPI00381DA9E2